MGLAYVHPNALNHSWDLKQGAPLKNPRAQHQGYVTAIITGALAAGAPWCTTWAAQLLSVSAWCQVAILSGYEHKRVARWAHSAIQRTYACTPHTSEKTAGYIHQHIKFFPRQRCCDVWAILQWLQTHAFWKGSQYSSWCLPERFSPNGITGAWCHDLSAVCKLWDMSRCDCPHCAPLNPLSLLPVPPLHVVCV